MVDEGEQPTKDVLVVNDIPSKVFAQFLVALQDTGEDPHLIAQLKKTLLEDRIFTDKALQIALAPREPHS